METTELNIRLQERKRAIAIAYAYRKDSLEAENSKRAAGDDLAFVEHEKSEIARYIANAISGQDALSQALGVTGEEILIQEEVMRKRQEAIEKALRQAIRLLNLIPNTKTSDGNTYEIIPKLEKALRQPD